MHIPTGEDIRTARQNKGLTQSELAKRAEVSQPLIARIESNDVDPIIDTLYRVVSALNGSSVDVNQEEVKISMPSVLKDARKGASYTQGELAEAAGVSQPLISRIERGNVNPRSSTLRSLFDQLDSSPASSEIASSTGSTKESDLLVKIEQEFGEFSDQSVQSESPDNDGSGENDHCPACDADLSSYANPSYCPDCGTEL